ncbi:hypothetical protein [Clostridium sp.]|uniref:hypothetical protein n=1 Tax=Clostridium sp. TaxID=1506 RepID=UPI002631732D|nr:hypothetical protein [Clostridium sp.]
MKFFLILNKKNLKHYTIYFLIIFILFSSLFLYLNKKQYISVLNYENNNTYSDFDLDGDGFLDKLEIIKESNKYIVNIHSQDNVYTLSNSDGSKYLGDLDSSFPIRVNLIDLSRDNIPEIIIRTTISSNPINYIFTFNKDNFINIFQSDYNLLGLLDSNNNRTPNIYSLSSRKGDSSSLAYMIINNEAKDISIIKKNIPGLNLIQQLIDYTEYPYELNNCPDIFSSTISKSEISTLWELNKNDNRYNFQCGYFYDYKWNGNGEFDGLIWELSFNKEDKKDSSSLDKEFSLCLTMEYDMYKQLKITSVIKK